MLFASTPAWIRVSSGINGQMLNREGKRLSGCGVYVARLFVASVIFRGRWRRKRGADKLTNASRSFNIPSPDDKAEETQALRAPLFSGLCVHGLRGSTCRAVSDKVGGYQSCRLWATLSAHWRAQPVWNHFAAAHFLWKYSSRFLFSSLWVALFCPR